MRVSHLEREDSPGERQSKWKQSCPSPNGRSDGAEPCLDGFLSEGLVEQLHTSKGGRIHGSLCDR